MRSTIPEIAPEYPVYQRSEPAICTSSEPGAVLSRTRGGGESGVDDFQPDSLVVFAFVLELDDSDAPDFAR
jgi:hypothetical protein